MRLGILAPSRHAVQGIVCPGPLSQPLSSQAQVLSHLAIVVVTDIFMAMIMVMTIPIRTCEGQYCMLWAISCSLLALHWLAWSSGASAVAAASSAASCHLHRVLASCVAFVAVLTFKDHTGGMCKFCSSTSLRCF
jgi:hypothetical protein